ncbi:hypothetical protein LT679_18375 [Mucilaginibacter roseus]|uniref:TonB-dependent receptor n=1 Tax=Mucilaginibacter roseus TaxID=1528868 RepID=A0ABS8U9S1_9SPHI|nr:hypothetical protein [Mucilaginibacter roseus]MCD8742583.1 hypothetical protein [Mucilaginibacter roseus]
MKKIALIALFSAAFSYARAQQQVVITAQPKKSDQNKSYVLPTDSSRVKSNLNEIVAVQSGPINNDIIVYSRMPVSKIHPYNSKMPVQGKGNKITGYNMPVKKVQIINPDTVGRVKITP